MLLKRRGLLGLLLGAPAIVHAGAIMPVRVPPLVAPRSFGTFRVTGLDAHGRRLVEDVVVGLGRPARFVTLAGERWPVSAPPAEVAVRYVLDRYPDTRLAAARQIRGPAIFSAAGIREAAPLPAPGSLLVEDDSAVD